MDSTEGRDWESQTRMKRICETRTNTDQSWWTDSHLKLSENLFILYWSKLLDIYWQTCLYNQFRLASPGGFVNKLFSEILYIFLKYYTWNMNIYHLNQIDFYTLYIFKPKCIAKHPHFLYKVHLNMK